MSRLKKILPVITIILSLIALAWGGWSVVPDWLDAKAYEDVTASVKQEPRLSNESGDNTRDGIPDGCEHDPTVNWGEATSKIPNAVGWITIKGTNIDLPVAQATPDDPEYWLHHTIWGRWSQAGSIFIDDQCKPNDDTVLFFGHKMANGTMFQNLGEVCQQGRFNTLGTLTFDAHEYGTTYYKPIASKSVNAYDTDVRCLPQMSKEEQVTWINEFYDTADAKDYSAKESITENKKYAVCITCSGYLRYGHDARTVTIFEQV